MYTCMSYWSSVRSWYPDIGQVLFFAFCLRHVLNKELIICPKQYSLLRMTDGANSFNLVPRARVSFGQNQDTELRNNQFPETKILGLPVSRRMRALVWIASRDKDDVDAFHKSIQYVLERQGKSRFGFEITVLKKKWNQKTRGLWKRACWLFQSSVSWCWPKDTWAQGMW